MKLTKKHIGKLFTNGGDGSWVYQLVDIKKGKLLFYSFDNKYAIETNKFADWEHFKSRNPFPKEWTKRGWDRARRSRETI